MMGKEKTVSYNKRKENKEKRWLMILKTRPDNDNNKQQQKQQQQQHKGNIRQQKQPNTHGDRRQKKIWAGFWEFVRNNERIFGVYTDGAIHHE